MEIVRPPDWAAFALLGGVDMTTVTCFQTDCLNRSKGECLANRVVWIKGRCSGYINSREAMKANNAPAVERKHGAIASRTGKLLR